ncbi:MAG: glycosyltransferase, partial [Bacteroidota bacterium]
MLTQTSKIVLAVTNDTFTDQRVHKVAKTLYNSGFQVVVVGKRSKKAIENRDYAKIVRLPVIFKKGFLFYAEFNLRLCFRLLFITADIFSANDLDTLPAIVVAAKIKRSKVVYDSHEYFTQSPEIVNRKIVRTVWQGIERCFINKIDAAITVSSSIAQEYMSLYKIRFFVIRNLPVLNKEIKSRSLPEIFKKYNVIIYQGSLNVGRGLENAIRSMQFMGKHVKMVIIGTGDIDHQLKSLVKSLKLDTEVFFPGRISPDELPVLTRAAVLGFSLEEDLGKNYRYALPNKLFDYIHAEIPVIVSALPEMTK